MKNNVFKITAGNKFQAVIVFLRGQLGLKEGDPLVSQPFLIWRIWRLCVSQIVKMGFCQTRIRMLIYGSCQFTYINAAFAPAPDDIVGNLFKCFGTEGHLIVNYRYVPPRKYQCLPDDDVYCVD